MGRGIEQLTVLKVGLGEIQPNVFHLNFRIYEVEIKQMVSKRRDLLFSDNRDLFLYIYNISFTDEVFKLL